MRPKGERACEKRSLQVGDTQGLVIGRARAGFERLAQLGEARLPEPRLQVAEVVDGLLVVVAASDQTNWHRGLALPDRLIDFQQHRRLEQ